MSQNYDVAFSVHAGRDLKEIHRFLTKNASANVAYKVMQGIFDVIETLQDQPERYPTEPLLAGQGNFRVIRKGRYDIFYEFTGYDIYIYRIVHARRDLKRLFKK